MDKDAKKVKSIANEIVSMLVKKDLSFEEAQEVLQTAQVLIGKCKITSQHLHASPTGKEQCNA